MQRFLLRITLSGSKRTNREVLSKIIILKTIQYIKFVVAVYFYYDEDLMLLFIGLFRQKNSLCAGEDPALSNQFNSSSFRTDSFNCRGIILFLLSSHAAFPTNSRTSAFRYSNTAAMLTGALTRARSA